MTTRKHELIDTLWNVNIIDGSDFIIHDVN